MSAPRAYSLYARLQHGLMAAIVMSTLALGAVMADIEPLSQRFRAFGWHKSLGLLVLALLVLRLVWRLRARVPSMPAVMPRWQQILARLSHGLMYVLLLLVPLSGWLYHSTTKLPLRWFGWFRVPALTIVGPDDKSWLQSVHGVLAWSLLVLLIVHIAAALKHHWIDRDDVLRRMFRSIP